MSNEYMSRQPVSTPKRQALSAGQPADLGLLLASCIRRRREKLGLSVERAAQLTGIEPSQWHALEAGWVPNLESGLLEAIAGTLEVSFPDVLFMADVSSAFQPLPV
jgi:transcriptional regulator with XRE-family HTH domain